MAGSPSLIAITMLARSGATALAWARLEAGGFAPDDPAALAVRGRLLKDRARAATGAAARALYTEAAAAYTASAAIDGASYPLINAATLTLLGGDAAGAARRAAKLLTRIDSGAPDHETPYYRAATRAEALLLLGRTAEARAALVAAISVAPDASEDHATTLRQFALILTTLGGDTGWLDILRPPRTLHYAGRIATPLATTANTALTNQITRILMHNRIGSAYGALAAGADITIAEALIAHGAALHIVLPAPVSAFAAASVEPFGAGWRSRFDAICAAAASIDEGTAKQIDSMTIALASERAMGRAIQTADRLATTTIQLVMTGPTDTPGTNTARDAALWHAAGRPQFRLPWPYKLPVMTPEPPLHARLVALLDLNIAAPASALAAVHAALAPLPPPLAAAATATGAAFAWPDPAAAATAAAAILAALDPAFQLRLAGHYAIIADTADPFTGKLALFGTEAARTTRLSALTPVGATYVSDDFLAGLLLRTPGFRHEYVGDAPGERAGADLPLHAIMLK